MFNHITWPERPVAVWIDIIGWRQAREKKVKNIKETLMLNIDSGAILKKHNRTSSLRYQWKKFLPLFSRGAAGNGCSP
jgi:hypothetical protein